MSNSYASILKLERDLSKNIFKNSKKLWGGAGISVMHELPQKDYTGTIIVHKQAATISALLYLLKNIIPYDYQDKYELFEYLTTNLPPIDPEKELIARAKHIYLERKNTKIYFAYGANMDRLRMKERCPNAEFITTAKIPKMKFIINSRGVATIVPDQQHYLEGCVWEITSECEKSLDLYEGVAYSTYTKSLIKLNDLGTNALVYLASDSNEGKLPRTGYLENIISSATQEDFSESYIRYLKSL